MCVLALVSSDTHYHVTSGPTSHSVPCRREEFCRREKEAVRHQSHNSSSRGHDHGRHCTGKNHTKRWHEHFTKVIATCLCWWLMGGSAALFDKSHDPRIGRNGSMHRECRRVGGWRDRRGPRGWFEEAGNAEGAAEAEQAEEEGVPPTKRVQWVCLHVVLWIIQAAAQTTQAEDAEDAAVRQEVASRAVHRRAVPLE